MSRASDASVTVLPQPVFVVEGLTKTYRMGEVEVHALRDVSLTLAEHEFVVLLGPSGSGKSTLLNILGGLDVPTAGRVLYQDQDLTASDDAALTAFRRHHVGFVFQFYNLIPSLTARENVALVTEIVENPLTPDEALRLVHLGDRLDHFPAQLSGGEQQRVAIARAIVTNPGTLFADEPTGNLDSKTTLEIMELLCRLNEERNITILMVTHEDEVAHYAKRIVHVRDGLIGSDVLNKDRPVRNQNKTKP